MPLDVWPHTSQATEHDTEHFQCPVNFSEQCFAYAHMCPSTLQLLFHAPYTRQNQSFSI